MSYPSSVHGPDPTSPCARMMGMTPRLLLLSWLLVACAPRVQPAAKSAPKPLPPDCWGGAGLRGPCLETAHLRSAMRIAAPPALGERFAGRTIHVYAVDLDSDRRLDFIVEEEATATRDGDLCFLDSTGRVRSCEPGAIKGVYGRTDGFSYLWFVQLDDSPVLELISLAGDSCSSDYTLQRLDPATWARETVARVSPLLVTASKDPRETYWGYPWDISDLKVEQAGAVVRILSAPPELACSAVEPGEIPGVPLFFSGVPTQGEPSDAYVPAVRSQALVTLAELLATASSSAPCPAGR